MLVKQGIALALAIVWCAATVAAEQEKDDAVNGSAKPPQKSSSVMPGPDAGKANIVAPGMPQDVAPKDLKIVAPDNFGTKDPKISAPPGKANPAKDIPAVVPANSSKKPILAAPDAPTGSGAASPGK